MKAAGDRWVQEVLKTTLSFNNSLEALTERSKLVSSQLQFIMAKGYGLESTRGKGAQSGGEQAESSQSSPPPPPAGESCRQCLFLPALMCDSVHGVLPTREARPSLGVQNFYWGLST